MTELGRILLAEDSENDKDLTLAAFEKHGLVNRVDWVRDGQQALDYLSSRERPVVVLLDLKMPRVDGLEVLKTIRSDPAMRTIPVVILTSSREEQDIVKSYDLGVNAYVVKPVAFADFIVALREVGAFWAVLNEPPPT